MKSLDRYVLLQLLGATFATSLALTFTVWLTQSLRLFDYIINRGLPAEKFVIFAALLMPSFLTIVMPIATFVSVVFVYNKLATDNELIVMRSCGLSQLQVAKPALLLGVVVTLLMFLITLYVLPLSFRSFKDLQHDIRTNYSAVLLQEGIFTEIDDNVVIYVGQRTPGGQLLDVLVHDTREPANPITIMSEVSEITSGDSGPVLILYRGQRQQFDRSTHELSNLSFDRYALELADQGADEQRIWREPPERYLHEIFRPPQNFLDERHRGELLANGHQRLALPLYTPALVLLGVAPFLAGEFSRRGYWKRILAAVVVVALIQVQVLAVEDVVANDLALIPLVYAGLLLPNLLMIWLIFWAKPERWSGRRPQAVALGAAAK